MVVGSWKTYSIVPSESDIYYIYYYRYVTKGIVCVQGHDPLIFSFLSFLFLTGWEFYGPNYLKC